MSMRTFSTTAKRVRPGDLILKSNWTGSAVDADEWFYVDVVLSYPSHREFGGDFDFQTTKVNDPRNPLTTRVGEVVRVMAYLGNASVTILRTYEESERK